MSKYSKIIDTITEKKLTHSELEVLIQRSKSALAKGDYEAKQIIEVLDKITPKDKYYIFMGFCPGADSKRRQDIRWRKESICDFFFYESEHQMKRFLSILPGDLVILKKIKIFGVSMELFGHGRVEQITDNASGDRILNMKWSDQDEIIEVPLIACNETVNVKNPSQVDGAMPDKFWEWLRV